MASATVDSPSDRLRLESIATVDLRLLSQSELYSLSLCSDAAFDPRRCDDIVIPRIDRSVFNESAGSRKQTYSRLRLAPRKPGSSVAASGSVSPRTAQLRTSKYASSAVDDDDPERAENSQIIGLLKELFAAETNGEELVPIRVEYTDSVPQLPNVANVVKKRGRGRPRKNENRPMVAATVVTVTDSPAEVQKDKGENAMKETVGHINVADMDKEIVNSDGNVEDRDKEIVNRSGNVEDRDKEILNRDGNVVDLVALANLEDPYGPELGRRTEGFVTEEELLGFLKGLNGQWGSRRKKKRIVEASEFGDALPRGWKLVLALKKKEGHVWLFCRRYIRFSRCY